MFLQIISFNSILPIKLSVSVIVKNLLQQPRKMGKSIIVRRPLVKIDHQT